MLLQIGTLLPQASVLGTRLPQLRDAAPGRGLTAPTSPASISRSHSPLDARHLRMGRTKREGIDVLSRREFAWRLASGLAGAALAPPLAGLAANRLWGQEPPPEPPLR